MFWWATGMRYLWLLVMFYSINSCQVLHPSLLMQVLCLVVFVPACSSAMRAPCARHGWYLSIRRWLWLLLTLATYSHVDLPKIDMTKLTPRTDCLNRHPCPSLAHKIAQYQRTFLILSDKSWQDAGLGRFWPARKYTLVKICCWYLLRVPRFGAGTGSLYSCTCIRARVVVW